MKTITLVATFLILALFGCKKDNTEELQLDRFMQAHVWTTTVEQANGSITMVIRFRSDFTYVVNMEQKGDTVCGIEGDYSVDIENDSLTIRSPFSDEEPPKYDTFAVLKWEEAGPSSSMIWGDPHIGPDRSIIWIVCDGDCKAANENLYTDKE